MGPWVVPTDRVRTPMELQAGRSREQHPWVLSPPGCPHCSVPTQLLGVPAPAGSEGRRCAVGAARPPVLSHRLRLRFGRLDDFPGSGAAGCGGVVAAALIPQPEAAERADKGCGGGELPKEAAGSQPAFCMPSCEHPERVAAPKRQQGLRLHRERQIPQNRAALLCRSSPGQAPSSAGVGSTAEPKKCSLPAEPPVPTST